MGAYTSMLVNPCASTLTPGFYGTSEGIMSRFKGNHSFSGGSSSTSGFMLWIADASGVSSVSETSGVRSGSIVGYRSSSYTNRPDNDTAAAAFNAPATTISAGGYSINDPAQAILSLGGVARDARTVSACMRFGYQGTLLENSGMVAYIDNLPVSSIISDDGTILTTSELFQLSSKVERIGTDVHEVKWRPGPSSDRFRGYMEPATSRDTTSNDAILAIGHDETSPGAGDGQPSFVRDPQSGVKVFGFAWRGLTPNTSSTSVHFDFIKNVEWRPEQGSGLPNVTPVAMHAVAPVHRAEFELDRRNPLWSTTPSQKFSTRSFDLEVPAIGRMHIG